MITAYHVHSVLSCNVIVTAYHVSSVLSSIVTSALREEGDGPYVDHLFILW